MYILMNDKNSDIVIGTRYGKGGKIAGGPFHRKLISCTANNFGRYVLGVKTSDLTGSFRLYRTQVLQYLLSTSQSAGFGFQMESIVRAELIGLSISEYPIVFYNRIVGKSKISPLEVVLFILAVFRLYLTL
jgi:dolichol-phosphate mannosyltransferase